MPITFTGDEFTSTNRVETGLHSLDWSLGDSLGNVGFPIKCLVEVYGPKNCGKTAFCLSVMGIMASKLKKNIHFLDWEGQSKESVEGVLAGASDFRGTVQYFLNLADEESEKTIKRFVQSLYEDNQPIAMMDSLGAFRPTANMEGELNDANMGAFSREAGRFTDWVVAALLRSKNPGAVFMTNHLHPKIGYAQFGNDTSGGEKKKFLSHIRIDLKRSFVKAEGESGGSTVDFGESWLLSGTIDSNRFGFSKRNFQVFCIGGEGIHLGLSAMWDCILWGYADLSAKKITESTTVSMDGHSFGKLGRLINTRKDAGQFAPFINRLKAESLTQSQKEEDEKDEPESSPNEPQSKQKRKKK